MHANSVADVMLGSSTLNSEHFRADLSEKLFLELDVKQTNRISVCPIGKHRLVKVITFTFLCLVFHFYIVSTS